MLWHTFICMPDTRTYADRAEYLKNVVAKRRKRMRLGLSNTRAVGALSVGMIAVLMLLNSIMWMGGRISDFLKTD